jgi:glucose-fructose oxidoreductase
MLIDTVTMKIRCAVVGMGHIAQVAVLPFAHARRNSQLAAIVSGDRTKRRELANRCRAQVEIERR